MSFFFLIHQFKSYRQNKSAMQVVHTVHEFRQIHREIPLLGIVVCQQPVVDKLPPKGVGDNNHNALGGLLFWWRAHVYVEAVQLSDLALGLALVDAAGEAVGAGHFLSFLFLFLFRIYFEFISD